MILPLIYKISLLFLPAAVSNGFAPILAKVFPTLDYPLDIYLKIQNIRLLGKHKTFRGLIGGILIGEIIFLIELLMFNNYFSSLPIFYGAIMGFAALFGDAAKSFFKRRLNIAPGKVWFPIDQVDWVICSLLFLNIWIKTDITFIIVSLILGLLASSLSKLIGWYLGINETFF